MKKCFGISTVILFSLFTSAPCNLRGNAVQIVDTTPHKPEPTGVQEFCSKLEESFKKQEDQKQINRILEEYRQNREDPNAWEDAQIKVMASSISPARKLEVQNFLNNLASH